VTYNRKSRRLTFGTLKVGLLGLAKEKLGNGREEANLLYSISCSASEKYCFYANSIKQAIWLAPTIRHRMRGEEMNCLG
jgi:hypothetical protein